MRIKNLLYAILATALIVSATPANADNSFAVGLRLSGANNSGFTSTLNGGGVLDGKYEGERIGVFGTFSAVQSEKNSLGKTQMLDLRGGITFNLTDNFEIGGGFRNTEMRFTEIGGKRTDTAPFVVANYDFGRKMRLLTEVHLPDSSQYETRAIAVGFQQTFRNNVRFKLRMDMAQFDYNAPITQSSTSASTEGLVQNTKSTTAPPGFERDTMTSYGYIAELTYSFDLPWGD